MVAVVCVCARVCVYHHHCLNTLAYTNICSALTSPYTSLDHPPPTLTPENSIADQGAENAVEYVTVNPDGTYLVTHDDTMGMGYTLLASDTTTKPTTPTTSTKPTTTTKSTVSTGASDPITMVLIGDSMSEYAQQTADKYCNNIKSTNKGIGGSTAEQVGR